MSSGDRRPGPGRVWRLCSKRHSALDGDGAHFHGGRWNRPGTTVVYTSATLSLASLEMLVHVDPTDLPSDLVAIPINVPPAVDIETFDPRRLPADWRRVPAPEGLADIGEDWFRRATTALLRVPSAVIPGEFNFILNPAHTQFRRLRSGTPTPFSDPRLWR